MEKKQEPIQLNIPAVSGDMVVRQGDAQPISLPNKVRIAGQIDTPKRFLEKRAPTLQKDEVHVLIDRRGRTINLFTKERDEFQAIITGSLKANPDLTAFSINSDKMWALKDLVNFLRRRRMFFESLDQYGTLIGALSDFSANSEIALKDKDDRKGNVNQAFTRATKMNAELEFTLNIPVFEGLPAHTFHVDVLADVTDGGVRFWLESIELIEIERKDVNDTMDAQVPAFSQYVVVEQ